jgi:hypothetical protein
MSHMVAAHHPTASSVELVVTQWEQELATQSEQEHASDLKLVINGQDRSGDEIAEIAIAEIALHDHGWERLGPAGFTQVRVVDGLEAGSEYHVSLRNSAESVAEATFLTLPNELPYTVLLGSCFWWEADPNRTASEYYKRLHDNPNERPHTKLLVGDQVYIDQPPSEWVRRKGSEELDQFIRQRYLASWAQATQLFSLGGLGAHIFITDDHEWWNNYPNPPLPAIWPALSRESYRNSVDGICRKYIELFQRVRPVTSFTIGSPPQLSVFVADTRINREQGTGRFMSEADMDQLVDWLATLRSPGVLVLGQPVFAPKQHHLVNAFGTGYTVTDMNLPGYAQFARLAKALQLAPHDVCVLAGDVHFGRTARVQFARDGEPVPLSIYEVIASPLSQLWGAWATFDRKDYPSQFPAFPEHTAPGVTPGSIQWISTVPTKSALLREVPTDSMGTVPTESVGTVPTDSVETISTHRVDTVPADSAAIGPQRTEEHFMTLRFDDAESGVVRLTVSAWLLRREGFDGLPALAFRNIFELYRRPSVLHLAGTTADGHLWHTIRYRDSSWQLFGDVEGPAGDIGAIRDVACATVDNELHLCAVTDDGHLWHTIRYKDGSWQKFGDVEGPAGDRGNFVKVDAAEAYVSVDEPPHTKVYGELHVCGVTADGRLWHTIRYRDGSWQLFGDVEGPAGDMGAVRDVACATTMENQLHVAGTTTNGRLWHTIRYRDGSWQKFGDVEEQAGDRGKFVGVDVAAIDWGLHVCGVTDDGHLWHTIRYGIGTWQLFGDVEGPAGDRGSFASVSAGETGVGDLHVAGTTADGHLWHTIRYKDGTWQLFGDVEGPAGDRGSFRTVSVDG